MFGMELYTISIIAVVLLFLFWLAPSIMFQFTLLGAMLLILVIILLGWEKVGDWLIGKLIK